VKKKYDTTHIRNIALVGSKGVGKTTAAEAFLFTAKATTRLGRVDEGNSIVDYDPIEVERKQSINSKIIPCEWKDTKINIIDTPGYADFIGDAFSGMWASDVVITLVDSVSGVEVATKRLYNEAKTLGRPRVFLINRMDNEHSNLDQTVSQIKHDLESGAALFQMPIGLGNEFKGVVDLIDMKAYVAEGSTTKMVEVPADVAEDAKSKRTELMEAVAESDEQLLEKYLESGELSEDELKSGIVRGVASGQLNPIFVGSAYENNGFLALLDTVVKYFPSPKDMPPVTLKKGDGSEVTVIADPNGPLAAMVFKVTSDPGVGDVSFFRVFSGTVNSGDDVYNNTQSGSERIGHLLVMKGKERTEVDSALAGDIVSIAKLKNTFVNDTLVANKNSDMQFDSIPFPKPVVPMAVLPKTKKDQDKLGVGLSKLTSIDPTFTYHIDKEFAETIVTAMGEVQIDVMVRRLRERYGVEIDLGKPHIPYREAITRKSEKQGKHKKQTGGHGQYGDCWLRLEPLTDGNEFEFVNAIVGGSIPGKYIPAVEKGVKEAMQKGIVAGYPVVGLKVTVFDGSYHEVDSSDLSFQLAGSLAFRSAMQEAGAQLLEPIADLEVYAPQDYMGDLSSDISSRRGRVSGMEAGVIRAKVPMAELYQYSASVKSITSGAGTYSMQFSHYEAVPAHIAQKVVDEAKREKEEKEAGK
jgi:elongation factor G